MSGRIDQPSHETRCAYHPDSTAMRFSHSELTVNRTLLTKFNKFQSRTDVFNWSEVKVTVLVDDG